MRSAFCSSSPQHAPAGWPARRSAKRQWRSLKQLIGRVALVGPLADGWADGDARACSRLPSPGSQPRRVAHTERHLIATRTHLTEAWAAERREVGARGTGAESLAMGGVGRRAWRAMQMQLRCAMATTVKRGKTTRTKRKKRIRKSYMDAANTWGSTAYRTTPGACGAGGGEALVHGA